MKRAERRGMYLGNSLLAQWGLRPFIECVVATVGTEVIVTSDHINAPLTWVPVLHLLLLSSKSDLCPEFVWAVVINKAPTDVMWREEQLLNFNVSTPKSLSFQSLLFIVWRDLWGHYFHPCVETPLPPRLSISDWHVLSLATNNIDAGLRFVFPCNWLLPGANLLSVFRNTHVSNRCRLLSLQMRWD